MMYLVQLSGVRGEGSEIGLMQFRLREVVEPQEPPTGRFVSFLNSFILVSPRHRPVQAERHFQGEVGHHQPRRINLEGL
jgi:hypothetical protein